MDESTIKANGPWILVRPEPPKKKHGVLYIPDGNLMERLGHIVGHVVSAGKGYWEKVKLKEVFVHCEVKPGDRVVFRGHLKEANRVGHEGLCFLHIKDLIGTIEEGTELDLALPYDN